MPPLLEIAKLSKSFESVRALSEISLTLAPGEIHALVGENGAGKSTLMKVLGGIHQRTSGEVWLSGKPIDPASPREALNLGICTVHQEVSLAPNLTVAENIWVQREPVRYGFIRRQAMNERSVQLLERFGIAISPSAHVSTLNSAQQQIVEIARALASSPKVLMLDEPTSSLENQEVEHLIRFLKELTKLGIGILYVTHKLQEVFKLATRVTVMRDGARISTKSIGETSITEMVRDMVGRELPAFANEKPLPRGSEVLRVNNLCSCDNYHDVSFSLYQNEIVGFAGLIGAGRSEIAQSLFGYRQADSGTMSFFGKRITIRDPQHAAESGIAYVPEERRRQALFPRMSVTDNMFSAGLRRSARSGLLDYRAMEDSVEKWMNRLQIRATSCSENISRLSGGNQQKVVLARWLAVEPKLLIADEPTRGIDVGAKFEIYAILRQLRQIGVAVLVISSELPELLNLCDRIIVLHAGTIAGELSRAEASEEGIMQLATGSRVSI